MAAIDQHRLGLQSQVHHGREWLLRNQRDKILYSLMYYRVDTPKAGSIKAVVTGWIRSTYLFRLQKDADGKSYFKQDDSCLGSPNHYATISDARKALAECEAKKRAGSPRHAAAQSKLKL